MTEKRDFPFWSENWLEAQRAYWDAWSSLYRRTPDDAPPDARRAQQYPWVDALDSWWKAVLPVATPHARDLFDRVIAQGKTFLRMSEAFTNLLQDAGDVAKSGRDWQALWTSMLSDLNGASPTDESAASQAMGGLLPFYALPLDTWRRTASSMSAWPGDWMQTLKPGGWEGVADRFHERTERFLSVPALGYTREWQEQVQKGARLALEYQRALGDYTVLFNRLGVDAMNRLSKRVMQLAEEGQEITSLRQIYDLWVDCGEEAYAEIVSSDEFGEVYARLVNALMALKGHGQNMVDEAVGALGMPTRSALHAVQKRLQDLHREVMALRRETTSGEVAAMRTELEDLRARMRSAGGVGARSARSAPSNGARRAGGRTAKKKSVAGRKSARRRGSSSGRTPRGE